MENRLLKCRLKRRGLFSGSGWLLVAVFFLFTAVIPAQGANDLLQLPAEKSDAASYAILMDVANVSGRLVAVGERGHILYSDIHSDTQCGEWKQAEVPVSVTLTGVYFPSDDKGWAVGHDGVVLHTKDGGLTWEKQLDGVKINILMLEQMKQLIKEKTALQEAEDNGLDEAQKEELAIELEDMDYFLSDLELAVEEGPTRPLMDVWFKNDREGFVMGSFGMILATSDGGKSWQPVMDRIENPDGFHYYAITRSGDDLFIAGEAGMLFRSEDFGRSWQSLESPYEGSFFSITSNPEGGFVTAFGLRGSIYYSLDRGETWLPSDTGKKASLSGGSFLSGGSLIVVGVDGSIFKSSDGGETFTILPTKFPGSVSVEEINRGVVIVVGLKGLTRIDTNNPSSKG